MNGARRVPHRGPHQVAAGGRRAGTSEKENRVTGRPQSVSDVPVSANPLREKG